MARYLHHKSEKPGLRFMLKFAFQNIKLVLQDGKLVLMNYGTNNLPAWCHQNFPVQVFVILFQINQNGAEMHFPLLQYSDFTACL